MKVIIYGVENTKTRLQVEKELGNENEMVGYIVDESIANRLFYEYKWAISLQRLQKYSYDVIILLAETSDENTQKKEILLSHGVEKDKILEYYWFGIYGGGGIFQKSVKRFLQNRRANV